VGKLSEKQVHIDEKLDALSAQVAKLLSIVSAQAGLTVDTPGRRRSSRDPALNL